MSVSVYDSATLSRAVTDLEDAQRKARIMRLFKPGSVHMSHTFEYGYDSDYPHILKFQKKDEGASPIPATIGTLKQLTFPKLRHYTTYTEEDAKLLDPSVQSYVGRNSNVSENFADKLVKQLAKMKRYIDTTHMVNCFTALRTGVVTFKYGGGYADETIDFGYGSAGTATTSIIRTALSGTTAPTAIWTHANATPIANIDTLADSIRATSQYMGEFDVIMGTAAFNAFITHSTVTNRLDNRRIEGAGLNLRESNEYKGNINGYDIYQVSNQYLLNTTWTQAWDTNTIAVIPREDLDWFSTEYGAPFDRPTAGSERLQFLPTPYFSKMFIEEDPPIQKLLVESRPIPVIKNTLCVRVQAVIS